MSHRSPARVVLVGFMGAGKSSVGRDLAARLGWSFYDLDEVVEAEAGRSVAEIFEQSGESFFRRLEAAAAERLLGRDGTVVAVGGGWAAAPGRLDALPPGTFSVWLRVSPEEAVRRAERQPGSRPLLAVSDPVAAARRLLGERSGFYAAADAGVDTDGHSVEDVTARILEILAGQGTPTGSE